MKKLLSTRTNNGLRYNEMTKVSHKRVLNFDKKEFEILIDLVSLLEFDISNKFDENTKKFVNKIDSIIQILY